MAQNTATEVRGVEAETNDAEASFSRSGGPGYREVLVVEVDGETVRVPVTAVHCAAFDYHGDVPDETDFAIVYRDGDGLHAEAEMGDGVVELYRRRGKWVLERFDEVAVDDVPGEIVWERDD